MEKRFTPTKEYLIYQIVALLAVVVMFFADIVWALASYVLEEKSIAILLFVFSLVPIFLTVVLVINLINYKKISLVVTDEGIYGEKLKFFGTQTYKYSYEQIKSAKLKNNYGFVLEIKNEEKPVVISNIANFNEAIIIIDKHLN